MSLSSCCGTFSQQHLPMHTLSVPEKTGVEDVTKNGRFACLTYHVVGRGTNQYTITETQFQAQLALLKAEVYVGEGFEQLEDRLRANALVPARYVVITVDDGHESSMRAADLLEAYGCRATFFLTRDRSLKKRGFIREPEIRDLRKRGFSLGTHGTTHHKLTFLPEVSCVKELREGKHWLEDVIGEEVRYMAAPGGFINSRVMKLTHEEGYVLAGTCNEWMNSSETMILRGKVNRVNIRQHFSTEDFRRIVEGDLTFYLWRQARAAALAIPKQLIRN